MLRIILTSLALAALLDPASAQYYGTGSNSRSNQVDGYYNNRGTYVDSYRRTNPNDSTSDNYNTRGNYNPYNGRYGRGY